MPKDKLESYDVEFYLGKAIFATMAVQAKNLNEAEAVAAKKIKVKVKKHYA